MRCPIFSKLKTLLLNDWCVEINFDALICFLEHTPVLEKLTLQLCQVYVVENLIAIAILSCGALIYFG
jgi:hypothetical protein